MTTDDRDLARLLPDPAHGLPPDRHHTLRERFVEQINADRTAGASRPRRRGGWALVGGFAAVMLVVGAAVWAVAEFRPPAANVPITPAAVPSPTETITGGPRHGPEIEQPPPFRVRYDGTELRLFPHTYCYSRGCADGFDNDPPSIGSPEEIYVFVPVARFTSLVVDQFENGDYCGGRHVRAEAVPLGDGWWAVHPRGPAGDSEISLFASGDGDMAGKLLWRTPSDQPLPEPEARLALIADHDGRPDSYGLELAVDNLPASPTQVSATITVTAGNGQSMVIEATRTGEACEGEGRLFFDGPDDLAAQAAQLGDFPFTTRVELVLDGVTHVATAVYPDDEIEGNEPSVALHFDPPLR